jgi:flap endonuclease-1
MGVKDLNPFLRENTPDAIKEVLLKEFSGKIVAIDTSIYFYKFLYKNDRFLEGFFQQIYRLCSNGITPIYVFDGMPPPEKLKTLQQRRDRKDDIKNTIKTLEDDVSNNLFEINRLKKKLISVTGVNIRDLKEMLTMMNIQYIQADGEADLVCGKLCKDGITDMVMSDDMDLLTSGARKVLRNFFIGTNKVLCYDLDKILDKMEFTDEQWVDFCIMCGCDYCDRIQGLGTRNAYKLLGNYGNTEEIMDVIKDKYNIPENYIDNYRKSKTIFNNNTITLDFTQVEIKHPGFNGVDKLINLLTERTHLTERQIINRIGMIYQ